MAKVKNQTSKIVTMVERDMDKMKQRQRIVKAASKVAIYISLLLWQ